MLKELNRLTTKKQCWWVLKCIYWFFAFFIFSSSHGQISPTNFEQYTVKDNLSANNVRRLYQDNLGFVWIGTSNGLNRFDGREFRVFKNDPTDSLSISDSFVTSISEDSNGNLWIGTLNGLNRFDRQTEIFTHVFPNESTDKAINQAISSVFVDEDGLIWVGTSAMGLIMLDANGKQLKAYTNEPGNNESIAQNNVLTIKKSHNGNLLLGLGGQGLSIFDKETGSFQNFYFGSDGSETTFRANVIRDILEDAFGNIWLASYKGLHLFNPETLTYEYFTVENSKSLLTENSIHKLAADGEAGFWIATFGGGLLYFDLAKKSFEKLNNNGLQQTGERSFFELLKTGDVLWAGTSSNGLLKMEFPSSSFRHLTAYNWGLKSNYAPTASAWGNNELWTAFKGQGLHVFKPPKDFQSEPINFIAKEKINAIIGQQNITGLVFDESGVLWLATDRNGLFSIDTTTLNVEHFRFGLGEKELSHMSVSSLAKDLKGNIWIGTAFGLNKWDRATGNISKYLLEDEGSFIPKSNNIRSIFADAQNRLWITTNNELLLFYNNHFTSVGLTTSEGKTYQATMLIQQEESVFLVGTTTGLIKLKISNENEFEVEDYSHIENMSKLRITSICKTQNDLIWLTAQHGLFSLDPNRSELKYFRSGLPYESPGLNNIFYLSDNSQLVMKGQTSLLLFDLSQVSSYSNALPTFLENIKINNELLKGYGSLENKKNSMLTFPFGNHVISVDLIALDYYSPNSINYQYRIIGLSPQWIDLGNQYSVSLVGLPSGKYELQMRAFLFDNQAAQINSLAFHIKTPFWRTWWFVMLIVLLIMTLVHIIYRYNLIRKLEIEKLRNKIARDLHDDIGATLTKISIFAEMGLAKKSSAEGDGYLEKISNLGREAVAGLDEIVWVVDVRNDQMGNLFSKIQDYALDILPAKDIRFDFKAEGIEGYESVAGHIRQNLYLICKEAINNMVKHSCGNTLKIVFRKHAKSLSIDISDNGKIDQQTITKTKGNGLSNVRNRAKHLGGKVEISTQNGFAIFITEIGI